MNYVLDTNIILLYLRDKEAKQAIERKYKFLKKENNLIISIVTVGEIYSIAKRNKWGNKRLKFVELFLQELIIIDIKYREIINAYAEIDTYS